MKINCLNNRSTGFDCSFVGLCSQMIQMGYFSCQKAYLWFIRLTMEKHQHGTLVAWFATLIIQTTYPHFFSWIFLKWKLLLILVTTRSRETMFNNKQLNQGQDSLGVEGCSCQDRALESMTSCNKFGIHYLFNGVLVSLLSIFIPCIILYEHSCLYLLHCT